jgi:hypothetical protein
MSLRFLLFKEQKSVFVDIDFSSTSGETVFLTSKPAGKGLQTTWFASCPSFFLTHVVSLFFNLAAWLCVLRGFA